MKITLDINDISGLSQEEATQRLMKEGFNEIPSSTKKHLFTMAFEVVREPMFLLLVGGGIIYLILGDVMEASGLLAFVFFVIGITLYQERKTERALEALRDLSSPRALVVRGGQSKRIPGREVVRGDFVIVSEGDRVPADAVIISCTNLSVDESLLTGESAPVRKTFSREIDKLSPPGGDDLPFLYSGTLVVQGNGMTCVQATGPGTELGKLGRALQTIEIEKTPLKKETERLARNFAVFGILFCTIVVLVYGFTRNHWLEGFLAGITLAMATIPEEIPVVLTVFLALGAWRIAQKHVLTRRIPAVETLGSATILCVDKTGTLTLNKMSVQMLYAHNEFFNPSQSDLVPEKFHQLIEFSILASQIDPFDPMEKALNEFRTIWLSKSEHQFEGFEMVREYPLSKKLMTMSRVWKLADGSDYIIATKGAPEAIFEICHLEKKQIEDLSDKIRMMASEGLRVIGVARAQSREVALPVDHHEFKFEFLGLVGLRDPVRPEVPEVIKECYAAGIRVVMITGDYHLTAKNIASQIGLKNPEIITGPEIHDMDDLQLQERARTANIFARVVPEQKLRIVNAFKANGEVVAMTGDGVNDAPALKSAHIGIAMGGRGTDVAREASAIVLLDDDFSSIVQAIKMGRRIFDNLKKAMAYIFAIHIPIVGMSLFPVIFNWPMMLLPLHIAFLQLIIDPACSLVFEAESEEHNIMARPPRKLKQTLFSRSSIIFSLMQGFSVLVIVLAVFLISLSRGQGNAEARALSFTTLIFANISLIASNRSWSRTILHTLKKPNRALWWIVAGAILFLGMVLYLPFLRELFRFGPLHLIDLVICFTAGVISVLWFEALKVAKQYFKFLPSIPIY